MGFGWVFLEVNKDLVLIQLDWQLQLMFAEKPQDWFLYSFTAELYKSTSDEWDTSATNSPNSF